MEDKKELVVKKGDFCFLANLCEFLYRNNLSITEELMGLMLGYYGFKFSPINIKSDENILGINQSFSQMFKRFKSILTCLESSNKLTEGEDFYEDICLLLEEKKHFLLGVNEYYLPHSVYYKKCNYWSVVDVIEVTDTYVVIYDRELEKVGKEDFLESFIHSEDKNAYFIDSFSQITDKDYILNVIKGFEFIVNEMISPKESISNRGTPGMNSFKEYIESTVDSNEVYKYSFQMKRAGGLITTRKNMYKVCEELKEKYYNLSMNNYIKVFEELSKEWTKISNLLFKLSTTMDSNLKNRIIQRIEDAISNEQNAMHLLEKELIPQLKKMFNLEVRG